MRVEGQRSSVVILSDLIVIIPRQVGLVLPLIQPPQGEPGLRHDRFRWALIEDEPISRNGLVRFAQGVVARSDAKQGLADKRAVAMFAGKPLELSLGFIELTLNEKISSRQHRGARARARAWIFSRDLEVVLRFIWAGLPAHSLAGANIGKNFTGRDLLLVMRVDNVSDYNSQSDGNSCTPKDLPRIGLDPGPNAVLDW